MLNELKFVSGAVARKDHVPALTHFRIADRTVLGFNGTMAISCPIAVDLNIRPKATQFVKAIQICKETIQLHMTAGGKLSVKSGKFRAHIDCLPDDPPVVQPEGQVVKLDGELIPVLKKLHPFIADDASRPWARGILLRGENAFATNNIVIVQHWLPYTFPVEINIPRSAISELIRIGEEPESIQVATNSATFHYSGQRWIRTSLNSTDWPDIAKVLDKESSPIAPPEGLFEAAEDLHPFVDELGRLFFTPGLISTGQVDGTGASVEIAGLTMEGCFNSEQLLALREMIKTIDFTMYPRPCMFFGEKLRGALVGMRI